MRSKVSSILRNATRRPGEPLNVLCAPTHESSQTEQAKTGHNFFLFRAPGAKEWETKYRPLPSNCTLLEPNLIPTDIEFDLILSQNNMSQYPTFKQLSINYGLPLVNYYHTAPHPELPDNFITELKGRYPSDANIFISAYSRNAWHFDKSEGNIVHHGIDTRLFQPRSGVERQPHLLSVVNDWKQRDVWCGYYLWESVVGNPTLPIKVLGDNPNLSTPAKSPEDLAMTYANSLVYLNTSLVSPIPTSLMEAAASGCAIVSTNNCAIPEIFTHGVDAMLSNDPRELRRYCETFLRNPEMAAEFGRKARETILSRFSIAAYINNLNNVFYGALKK